MSIPYMHTSTSYMYERIVYTQTNLTVHATLNFNVFLTKFWKFSPKKFYQYPSSNIIILYIQHITVYGQHIFTIWHIVYSYICHICTSILYMHEHTVYTHTNPQCTCNTHSKCLLSQIWNFFFFFFWVQFWVKDCEFSFSWF